MSDTFTIDNAAAVRKTGRETASGCLGLAEPIELGDGTGCAFMIFQLKVLVEAIGDPSLLTHLHHGQREHLVPGGRWASTAASREPRTLRWDHWVGVEVASALASLGRSTAARCNVAYI